MECVQFLESNKHLDTIGSKWGKSTVETPKCSSCLFVKLERRSKPGKIIKRIN